MTVVTDSFGRSVAGGWGVADSGDAWLIVGAASAFTVAGGYGLHSAGVVNTSRWSLTPAPASADVELSATVSTDALAAGGSHFCYLAARSTSDGATCYLARLELDVTGAVTLSIRNRVAGVETAISSAVVPGLTHTPGTRYGIRFYVQGTTLRARAWLASAAEPPTWLVDTTDAAVVGAGRSGVRSILSGNSTNTLPVTFAWDNFTATYRELTAQAVDTWPPRVMVAMTMLTTGDQVEVYRDAGAGRQLLRGGALITGDPSVLRFDGELPFGVPVRYVAVVNGATEYATPWVSYTLPGGLVALTDAITGQAAEVVILAWPDRTRSRDSSVFRVGGRSVAVLGPLGGAESTVELMTETTTARDQLVALLEQATEGVVQIRQPGGYDGVDTYVAVLDVVERRWSQDGTDQRRVTAVNVVEVEGWAPALEARGTTLQDLADTYPAPLTLADVAADYPTLLAVARALDLA